MQAHPSVNLPRSMPVWPENARPHAGPDDQKFPNLTWYLPSEEHRTGQTVLILPGGGYGLVSSAKEGHRPAQLLCAHGIAAAVLEYRHSPQRWPVPLLDAQRGLRICRSLAAEHGLDPARVGVMGFSAGGHLAGLLAMHPEHPETNIGDSLDTVSAKPDFQILLYPVVSFVQPFSHFGSRDNLLGKPADPDVARTLSLETLAGPHAPPAFLLHAQDDAAVVPANSHLLTQTLTQHGVNTEFHLVPEGGHGFGLAANHPWGQWLLDWLRRLSA
ncbi:MAG: alpha/beta hydrolase [Verrucomicrobia bacterium]|nr:alpha/beta hydrolase [Verrucomicrobiota bacterium]MCH8527492.1 alpha/beta hydrolase [Kiritimatiellia bacterium]